MIRITSIAKGADDLTVTLPDESAPRIGRDPATNDVILHDAAVSRRHARLLRRAGAWVVQDLGSRTGTFLNGLRVTGEGELSSGDVIELGPYVLRIELGVDVGYQPVADTEQMFVSECPRCHATVFTSMTACLSCGASLASRS